MSLRECVICAAPVKKNPGPGRQKTVCSEACCKAMEIRRRAPGKRCSSCGQILRAIKAANQALARAEKRFEKIFGGAA